MTGSKTNQNGEGFSTPQRPASQPDHVPNYTISDDSPPPHGGSTPTYISASDVSPTMTDITSPGQSVGTPLPAAADGHSPNQQPPPSSSATTTPVKNRNIAKKSTPRQTATLIMGMTKPALILFVLLAAGILGYSLYGYIRLPKLTTQADELEMKVDRLNREIDGLQTQVNLLEEQVDVFEGNNDQLNRSIADLTVTKDNLNASTITLREERIFLNETNQDLMVSKEALQVVESELDSTTVGLKERSDHLGVVNQGLREQQEQLGNLSQSLYQSTLTLTEDTAALNESIQKLNGDVSSIIDVNQNLTQTETDLKSANGDLSGTIQNLTEDVATFGETLADLTVQNERLAGTTSSLRNLTWVLGNTTFDQNSTIVNINETVANLTIEFGRLDDVIDELVNSTAFFVDLNDTALATQTSRLADAIEIDDALKFSVALAGVQDREISTLRGILLWDCVYTKEFERMVWVKNLTFPIPDNDYRSEIEPFIEEKVGDFNICLNDTNFWEFFNSTYSTADLTSELLIGAVDDYTSNALSHYFPKNGECGVTVEEWSVSGNDCENLNNKYLWNSSGPSSPCAPNDDDSVSTF